MTIYAVCTFNFECLVEVDNGSLAEEKAREYLIINPDALKLITLSCEPTKIRRIKKVQGGIYK